MVFGIDRAGIVGSDGETHQGIFDVGLLTSVPNTTIYSPPCYDEVRLCLSKAINEDTGIVAVRYPRGSQKQTFGEPTTEYCLEGNGADTLIVTYGRLSSNAARARAILSNKDIKCDILRLVSIYPISQKIPEIFSKYKRVIFFEESYFSGSISEKYTALCSNVVPVALTGFIRHAPVDVLLDENGLSAEKMAKKTEDMINAT